MYTVIESGGKQHRVKLGSTVKLEKLDTEAGSIVEFDKVLLIVDGDKSQIGTPYLEQKVSAEVIKHGRHSKINILKFQRRKHHLKQMGHRQDFTEVKIIKIADQELTKPAPKKAEAPKKKPATEPKPEQTEEK